MKNVITKKRVTINKVYCVNLDAINYKYYVRQVSSDAGCAGCIFSKGNTFCERTSNLPQCYTMNRDTCYIESKL